MAAFQAAFQTGATKHAFAALGTHNQAQVEVIWQMGRASLSPNNNELILPVEVAGGLSQVIVEELKIRLSDHLGGIPTLAFLDLNKQVFRICKAPDLLNAQKSSESSPSSELLAETEKSQTPGSESPITQKPRALIKMVPRPPNAFILYRKEHHPLLKQQQPDLHNNDISVILGKQWKAEPESVKARYKDKAESIKRNHTADNPGYQYAPRKPSEKKRRMTARKMAQLQATTLQQNPLAQMAPDVRHITGVEQDGSGGVLMLGAQVNEEEDFDFFRGSRLTAADILQVRRPATTSHMEVDPNNRMVITMPAGGNRHLQQEAETHTEHVHRSPARIFDPSNAHITTQPTPYVTNDQDFFDSLIDWNAIASDVAMVKNATPEELARLGGVEMGNSHLSLSQENQRTAFESELER